MALGKIYGNIQDETSGVSFPWSIQNYSGKQEIVGSGRVCSPVSGMSSAAIQRVSPASLPDSTNAGFLDGSFLHDNWLNAFHLDTRDIEFSSSSREDDIQVFSTFRESVKIITIDGLSGSGVRVNGVAPNDIWHGFEEKTIKVYLEPGFDESVDAKMVVFFPRSYFSIRVIADILVVWPWLPDWKAGIDETFSFKTSILQSRNGTEQRARARRYPRHQITFSSGAMSDGELSLLHDTLEQKQNQKFLVPFFQDITRINSSGEMSVNATTAHTRFVDGALLIMWKSSTNYEANVQISHSEDSINTKFKLGGDKKSHYAMPARKMLLENNISISQFTSSAGFGKFSFSSDIPPETARQGLSDYWIGAPILDWLHTWDQDPKITHARIFENVDFFIGGKHRIDLAKTGTPKFQIKITAISDEEISRLLDIIYYLQGKLKPLWITLPASTGIVISKFEDKERILYASTFPYKKLSEGNRNLFIQMKNGTKIRTRITSFTVRDEGITEIYIDRALPLSSSGDDIATMQFMRLCRSSSDDLSIKHLSPDVAEVTLKLAAVSDAEVLATINV